MHQRQRAITQHVVAFIAIPNFDKGFSHHLKAASSASNIVQILENAQKSILNLGKL
jgi:hypothetical protein